MLPKMNPDRIKLVLNLLEVAASLFDRKKHRSCYRTTCGVCIAEDCIDEAIETLRAELPEEI